MNRRLILLCVIAAGMFLACEFPKDPDFETSQRVEIPILADKPYQFMGQGDDVLIDTTSSDFDSLFIVDDATQFVSLARSEDFDFGDLDDAIPEVQVDPTSFNAEVGELELGDFSSQGEGGNLGEADFQTITGQDPATFPAGSLIPLGGSAPPGINIDVDTDYFVSATIKSGSLRIEIVNTLGFDLDRLELGFNAGPNPLGTFEFLNVNHDDTLAQTIQFNQGDVIEDINIDIGLDWSGPQTTQADAGAIIVSDASGENLIASQIVAAVEPQDFTFNDTFTFDDSEFRFEDQNDFVQLSEGRLVFQNFRNDIGIGIDNLIITFPGILLPGPGNDYSETLSLEFLDIAANSAVDAPDQDLAGARITAPGNLIEYEIFAATENTQGGAGSTPVTITENDQVNATVAIENIVLDRVVGVVVPREVLLNDDEFEDGNLDLFNDIEAELTEIDGLDEISQKVDGFEFTNPQLNFDYQTNIGIDTDIIGAFVGVNGKGERVFLTGDPGSAFQVQPGDPIDGLFINGQPLQPNQLIKFPIVPSGTDGSVTPGSLTFDRTTTNVDAFLNNLPSEIRFIGKAAINPDSQSGGVGNPVVFDPQIDVSLPFEVRANNATFSDTVDADLGDLPGEGDDAELEELVVYINYTNGLPLGFNLDLIFLDENDQEIPNTRLEDVEILPGEVDANGFVTSPSVSALVISFNESQRQNINQTRKIELEATLQTTSDVTGSGFIRFRTTDEVVLGLSLSAGVINSVN